MEGAVCVAALAFFFMMCALIYILFACLAGAMILAFFEDSGRIKEEHAIVIGGLWPLSLPLIFFGMMVYLLIKGIIK